MSASHSSKETGEQIPLRRHRVPHIETYELTEDELGRIENEALGIGEDSQFCSISLTAAISFLVAMLTVSIDSQRVFISFLVVTIVGFVFAAYFGVRWYKGRNLAKSVFKRIREREVGPLGEQGREIGPAELAQLPSEPEEPEESVTSGRES